MAVKKLGNRTGEKNRKPAVMKREWTVFINEMIQHGDKTAAYQAAYPSQTSKKNASVSATILLRKVEIYTPIVEAQQKFKEKIEKVILEASEVRTVGEVLDKAKKREILNNIATGKLRLQKISFNKLTGEPVVVEKLPDHTDIMKAIDLDSKLNGDFAPIKIGGDKNPAEFSDYSDAELKKLLTENEE